MVLGVKKSLKT